MAYHVGFLLDQVAGHVTMYRNLRSIAPSETDIHPSWYEIHFYKPGGKIERLHNQFMPWIPSYYPSIVRATVEMRRALQHQHFDAIMTNSGVSYLFGNTFRQVPTLIDFDVTALQLKQTVGYNLGFSRFLPNLKTHLDKRKWHDAALLQAWSNWAKESAVRDYGIPEEKIRVNPPGVNLDFWKPAPTTARTNSAGSSTLRVLFVGGDFVRKGGPKLIEWYKNQDTTKCELHIVTREPIDAPPGVYVYTGMQPNTEALLQLYQQSDLFVLPSLAETFGLATIEAMAVGLPVIACDVGGVHDIISHGYNGYVIAPNDSQDLVTAIKAILEDEERRKWMGQQSRRLAEQHFNLVDNARRTFGYLKEIAATGRKRSQQSYAA